MAKRVHGVKGFDAAHNKAGEIVEKHRLVTVDGDNRVHKDSKQTIEIDEDEQKILFLVGVDICCKQFSIRQWRLKLWPQTYY